MMPLQNQTENRHWGPDTDHDALCRSLDKCVESDFDGIMVEITDLVKIFWVRRSLRGTKPGISKT